ncbi:LysR family transcriptional regulator [Vibrio breoganii]|uniref:LysR family transcriptional regulator n=1 Tax=Vibrio breoganii TaxID=553239 RepID=UPI000C81941A|nr:LysR family transcriptional regulator [Vibrio breoganii]PML93859.1 hypothetical protein BCT64_01555 [Vibrio breoganii]PMN65070.1 hypothetical protein BCT28_06675 [Vibrio breoganii]
MTKDKLKNLDLNLLKLFSVVYQQRNLKRSSELLFISPPAVSQNISKLRNHFDDELFIKTTKGFDVTPFADSLFKALTPIMEQLSVALNEHHQFDPGNLEGTITIEMGQQILPWLPSLLFSQIANVSPNVAFAAHNITQDTPRMILSEQVDMAIQFQFAHMSKDIYEMPLVDVEVFAMVREDHPLKEKAVEVEALLNYNFALIEMPLFNQFHSSLIEASMEKRGTPIKVMYRSTSASSVKQAALNSDLIFPALGNYAKHCGEGLRAIQVTNIPEVNKLTLCAYIHRKNRKSKKHLWLYEMVKSKLLGD